MSIIPFASEFVIGEVVLSSLLFSYVTVAFHQSYLEYSLALALAYDITFALLLLNYLWYLIYPHNFAGKIFRYLSF